MKIEIPDAIKEEWGKLVPAAKYSVIIGLFLILTVWFDDYLKLNFFAAVSSNPDKLTLKQYGFGFGVLSILLVFPILILDRLFVNLKIIYYKLKYPLKTLNKDFYVVSFNGGVFILDEVRKELRWIKNWQTALDLELIGEWTNAGFDPNSASSLVNKTVTTKDGKQLNLNDFKYVDGVCTQGIPGT